MIETITTYIGETCVISGLGLGTKQNFDALLSNETGLRLVENAQLGAANIPLQLIADDVCPAANPSLSRLENLMVTASLAVVNASSVDVQSPRVGIVVSTTKGNIAALTPDIPAAESNVFLSVMAQRVADAVGITATPIVVSNACTSGVSAVIVAARYIRAGLFDHVLVVGGDEVTQFTLSGFQAFKSVSDSVCRPYDSRRNGLSLGEAAAALLITNDESLSMGVVVEGGAITNDANHISGPSRTGDALCAAITQAIDESGVQTDDISFINAHGTATPYNDEMESKAIALAQMTDIPVNSLKPYFGHTLGASGVVEIIMCAEQLMKSVLIGTLGFENIGVPVPLNVSAENRKFPMLRCVKTASGFGGCNAAVVLSRDIVANSIAQPQQPTLRTIADCQMANGTVTLNGSTVLETTDGFDAFIRQAYHSQAAPNLKFFKMDNLCKLGYVGANYLLEGSDVDLKRVAIVLANRSASLDTDIQHQRILQSGEPASPATFVYTLANIVEGEICIKHKIQGETTFFISDKYDKEVLDNYAKIIFSSGKYSAIITGWCEFIGTDYNLNMTLQTI